MPPPLLSRSLDPILGVFTGAFAYYLYEKHPRTEMPEELRLMSLLKRKREQWQQERERRLLGSGEDNVDWHAITAAVDSDTTTKPSR